MCTVCNLPIVIQDKLFVSSDQSLGVAIDGSLSVVSFERPNDSSDSDEYFTASEIFFDQARVNTSSTNGYPFVVFVSNRFFSVPLDCILA